VSAVFSGNASAGNISSLGTISASGNIIGGNVNTGGLVSATGNVVSASTVVGAGLSISGTAAAATVNATSLNTGSIAITGNTATVTSASYAIGYRDLPQITSLGTLALTDGGKHYYGSGTLTVPTNGAVPLPIGTAVLVIATSATTIVQSSGISLIWAGVGTTGNRTLAQHGVATLVKVATNTWYVSGSGLS
jgi:hypothetical protein